MKNKIQTMVLNPYESPQAPLTRMAPRHWPQLITTLRAAIGEVGISLGVMLLLFLPLITQVPGTEQRSCELVSLLGSAGVVHPARLPFAMGIVSLLTLVLLTILEPI